MYLELDKFSKMFDEVETSAFRLQLLDAYSVEFEREDYEAFISGRPLPNRENVPWLNTIATNVAAGRTWVNIHVLPPKLTNYLRYIIDWWYIYHACSGADIRFLLAEASRDIRRLAPRDYWLFDDKKLVWMEYDTAGRFLGPVLSSDMQEIVLARQIRDKAIQSSITLSELLALRRQGSLI